jgi:sugar phosphate isomerase/epimerase
MKSCLNATTLDQSLGFAEFVRLAGEAGFAGVEVRMPAAQAVEGKVGIGGLKALFAEAKVGPANFGASVGLHRPSADFAEGLQKLAAECALGRELGIATVQVVLPFRRGAGEQDPGELARKIGLIADVARDHDLGVVLEFLGLHPPADQRGDFPTTLGKTLDLIERVGRPNVGVLIDSYHWYLGGSDPADLARIPRGMPLFVHINDAPPGPVDQLTDPMRVLPGTGVLDLPAWLAEIRRATGYDGFASLELFNEGLRRLPPREAARRSAEAVNRVLARV